VTRNIIDIIKENTMDQPTPTEKAQIVVMFTYGATNIFRFNTVKKAEKEYAKLLKAWSNSNTAGKQHAVDGDMFVGAVDLYQITSVCIVDHAKRAKFVPIPG
jgi:hypothetical protein